jgi:hypothetical protein
VPEGHELSLYRTVVLPSIVSTKAVVWLAHLGSSSDEAEEELDTILTRVDALMQGARPRILLSTGTGRLSSLMAPNNPPVLPHPHGMLVWTVDADGLAGAPRGSSLVQRWLRCIYTLGTRGAPPLQSVFLHKIASPRARAVAALVRGLGPDVRVPDAEKATVLVEVRRPEGVILSAMVGSFQDPADPADAFALEVNQAKDRAEKDADTERLQRLEAEERDALESKLAPEAGAPRVSPVLRAPHLRRLLLAAADHHGDTARRALYEELLRREVPLQVIIDPKTMGAELREWPGGVALPVYADESSLLTSARNLGKEYGTFAGAIMTPPELFDWAAGHSWPIAMNVFRAPNQPVYVVLTADEVKALARGRMPTSSAT